LTFTLCQEFRDNFAYFAIPKCAVRTMLVTRTAWVTGAWWWELVLHVGNSAQQDSVVCVNGA